MNTTRDPYEPYGLAKKHPPVPEPASYGLILMAVVLGALAIRRWRK